MASRDTEGRREIQAARKRLAAAKSQSSSAAKALESATGADNSAKQMAETAKTQASSAAEALKSAREAKDSTRKMAEMAKKTANAATKSREVAKSQYDDSKKEVKEAEAFLREAEERCEVVDVDSNDGKGLFDVDTDNESNENEGRKKKKQKTGFVEAIVVEGSGNTRANGTYKRSDERLWNGSHQYYKKGQWEGEDATYEIWHSTYLKKWCIGVGEYYLYKAPATTDAFSKVPPENGWKVHDHDYGVNPAPTLKWS